MNYREFVASLSQRPAMLIPNQASVVYYSEFSCYCKLLQKSKQLIAPNPSYCVIYLLTVWQEQSCGLLVSLSAAGDCRH